MLFFMDLESYGAKYFEKHGRTKAYATLIKSVDYQDKFFGVNLENLIDEFLEEISERAWDDPTYRDNKIFAHNGGKFDYHFMLSHIVKLSEEKHNYKLSYLIEDNKQILTLDLKIQLRKQIDKKRTKKTVHFKFRDSVRLWPMSLAQIGTAVGLPKLEIDDYDILDEFETNEDYINYRGGKDWEYLNRDVDALIEFYKATKDVVDIEFSALTSSSVALDMMIEKNDFLSSHKFWVRNKETWDAVNDAYLGGFTWVNPKYQLKRLRNIWKYDVNSLYPDIMQNNSFPYGSPSYEDKARYTYKIYRCKAKKATAKSIPFYPFGISREMRELSGNAIDQYRVENEDVEFSVNNYMLDFLKKWYDFEDLEVEFAVSFRERRFLFTEFHNELQELKIHYHNTDQPAKKQKVKIISNGAYGKMGQNPERQSVEIVRAEEIVNSPLYEKTAKTEYYDGFIIEKMDDDHYFIRKWESLSTFIDKLTGEDRLIASFVPIADKITALARIKLLQDIMEIPDKCVYFDTDSIHSTIPLDDYLEIDPAQTGCWKYEGTVSVAVYRRSKHYLHKDIDEFGKIDPYLLKGGGFNVKKFNKDGDAYKKISIKQYLQPDFIVEGGNLESKRVKGGVVLTERPYIFSMPAAWYELNNKEKKKWK